MLCPTYTREAIITGTTEVERGQSLYCVANMPHVRGRLQIAGSSHICRSYQSRQSISHSQNKNANGDLFEALIQETLSAKK